MSNRRNYTKYLFESPSVKSGEEEELKRSDFDFIKRLGDGAFGQVWRVRHKGNGKIFGLKIVPKEKVLKMLSQFRREIFIMYELDHPHIIKLYNHFEDEKYFYLIMEIAEGGNLFQKLFREKQFIERTAAQYFREVVLAVEYLHSHVPAIIHRDIKPENILLDSDSRIKLTDFGWSNYYSPENQNPRTTICGTLEYLPPEMVHNVAHNTGVDVWCLGVLLYEMLVGSSPFKAAARQALFNNITKQKPKFPLSFPPLAKELIGLMLQKEPENRLSIQEVKQHRWLQEHPPIRETLTQNISEILLPDFNQVTEIQKGYKVIAQENRVSDNNKQQKIEIKEEVKKPEIVEQIRQSIDLLKKEIKEIQQKGMGHKETTLQIISETDEFSDKIKKLESKIQAKRKELNQLQAQEKQLINQVSDLQIDLQQFQDFGSIEVINQKLNDQKQRIMNLDSNLSLLKKRSSVLGYQSEQKIDTINSKQEQLQRLQQEQGQYEKMLKTQQRQFQQKYQEYLTNREILNYRINNFDKFSTEFSEKDQITAIQIQSRIETFKVNQPEQMLERVTTLIEQCEEDVIKQQQKIEECKLYYNQKKSQLLQSFQKRKQAQLSEIQEIRQQKLHNLSQQVELKKQQLRQKLEKIRKDESEMFVSEEEIQELRDKLLNLKVQSQHSIELVKKQRDIHEAYKESIQASIRRIELSQQKLADAKNQYFQRASDDALINSLIM